MYKKTRKLLSKCDAFGAEVKLNLRHKEKFQSGMGGCLTISVVAIITIIMVRGIISLLNQEQYTTTSTRKLSVDPQGSNITANDFMIGIHIESPLKQANKRLFDVVFQFIVSDVMVDGTKVKLETDEQAMEQCSVNHLSQFNNSTIQNRILLNKISEYYCLPLNLNMELQGTYTSDIFKYGRIKIKTCQMADCYTLTELNDLIKNGDIKQSYKISTVMLNSLVDLQSDINYSRYIYSDFFIETTLGNYTIDTNIFLERNIITIDKSIVSLNNQIESKLLYAIMSDKLIPSKISASSISTIAQFYIRLDQQVRVHDKQFYKFDQFLSYVGGILKFLASFFGFFVMKYNKKGLQIRLANLLYQFDVPQKKNGIITYSFQNLVQSVIEQLSQIEELIQKFKHNAHKVISLNKITHAFNPLHHQNAIEIKDGAMNHTIVEPEIHRSLVNHEVNHQNHMSGTHEAQPNLEAAKLSYLNRVFGRIAQSKNCIDYGLVHLIQQVLRFIKRDERAIIIAQLIDKSTRLIQNDMDILVIIDKMQQSEKMRNILLDKNQQKIFRCLPKPVISVADEMKTIQQQLESNSSLHQQDSYPDINIRDMNSKRDSMLHGRKNCLLQGRFKLRSEGNLKLLYSAYEDIVFKHEHDHDHHNSNHGVHDQQDVKQENETINDRLISSLDPTILHSFRSLIEIEQLARSTQKGHLHHQDNIGPITAHENRESQNSIEKIRLQPNILGTNQNAHSRRKITGFVSPKPDQMNDEDIDST